MTVTRPDGTQQGEAELPFTPWGLEQWESYDVADGDYTGSCMPFGLARSINSPWPMQIMQNSDYFAFLFEQNTWFHSAPLDGRERPDYQLPTWFGHSIGRWEGDTLIIETNGFNGWTRLDTIGHPHSDQLRLIQTFERPDVDRIVYSITVDDPKTFTMPWKNVRTFTQSDTELMEDSCEKNNRDLYDGHIAPWRPPTTN